MHSIIKFKSHSFKYGLKVLPVIILGVIIFDLFNRDKIGLSFDFLLDQDWQTSRFLWLIPVIGLMFINWSFEAFKWKSLIQPYYRMSFSNAFRSIWSGVSTALSTPNRLGDFIGKISHLPKDHRKKGVVSSFYGSYSQWLITVIMGWIGWLYYGDQIVGSPYVRTSISVIGMVLILLFVFLFISRIAVNLVPEKWKHYFKNTPDRNTKFRIVFFSFMRYLAFATQFYLLVRFLGLELGFITVFLKVTLFYLITSFVPVSFWGEIGIKESVAVWVFSGLIYNSLIIISITLLLWLINLVIPALVGNYFLIKTVSVKRE
jgi:hypothetical protein